MTNVVFYVSIFPQVENVLTSDYEAQVLQNNLPLKYYITIFKYNY